MRHRNIRQAREQSLMLQQTYLFRRRNFQMLLNTHSKAFSQQQLPLLVFPPENENLKKSWPAKIKHGWIPHRVCHFAKEDFKRDLQVYKYWSGISKISLYWNIGLGNIRFILKSQSTSPKYHYIGARKPNQAIY